MSQHPSLKTGGGTTTKRTVLKRFERVELLRKRGEFKEGSRITGLKKTKPERKDKPIRIQISNPLYDLEEAESCLIVKDVAGEGKKAAKEKLRDGNILGVTKVLRVSNLKKKFATHEQKRQLCKDYALFLADTRILPLLPKLLGKTFFKKKKQPVPVDLRVSSSRQPHN